MNDNGKIIELLADMLHEQRGMRKEQEITNHRLENLEKGQDRTNRRLEKLEKAQEKTNLAISELRLSFMRLADKMDMYDKLEKRVVNLETVVLK